MALLTRSRRSSEPTETLDRAREVSEQVAGRAREVSAEALERAVEAADRARDAAEPRLVRARDVAEPAVVRAREASGPALARLRWAVGAVLRVLVRVIALAPGIGAQVLETVARLLGRLADRSAQLAQVTPPPPRRRRAGLWFAGGFVAGAAAGYAVSEMRHGGHEHADEPWQPATVAPPRTTPAEG